MSTGIEWCDEVWNPTVGCSRVSAGCDNCYAMGVAHRKMSPSHVGLTKLRPKDAIRPGVDWTGAVRCIPERLGQPLKWRKPRRVFVNSMSDLFHPGVPFDFIDRVYTRMLITSLCDRRHHTYLVLTKRPQRALEYLTSEGLPGRLAREAGQTMEDGDNWHDSVGNHVEDNGPTHPCIHLGVSAEDQATFDERVPLLLECPAAVRWVSAEPLIGYVDVGAGLRCEGCGYTESDKRLHGDHRLCKTPTPTLDWLVVGGESGPRSRPCCVSWIGSIVEQCQDSDVPVFVKQLGSRAGTHDRKGGDPEEWPADLRVRQFPKI